MKPIRLMFIGLDSLSLRLVERFAKAGRLPVLSEFMRTGAACDLLSALPPYTPTNWATLCTGAWTGTHGAGNWDSRKVADPPDRQPLSTFDSRTITCETIFEAAERQGLTSLAIQYPGAWPSRTKNGMVVAPLPYGLSSLLLAGGRIHRPATGDGQQTRPASGWGVPVEEGDREFDEVVELRRTVGGRADSAAAAAAAGAHQDGAAVASPSGPRDERSDTASLRFHFLLPTGTDQRGKVLLFLSKDDPKPAATLTRDGFSDWVRLTAHFPGGTLPCAVRFRLVERSPDGRAATIIRSEIYPGAGFTTPDELAGELYEKVGPFFEHTAVPPSNLELYDYCLEELDGQTDWIYRTAKHLQSTRGYDLFYLHWHFPDSVLHAQLGAADPESPSYRPKTGPKALEAIGRALERSDAFLGRLLELADEETAIAVVADHGNAANKFGVNLGARLKEAGLIVEGPDGKADPVRSKVRMHGGWQVCVNLRGRDVDGCVEPPQYEAVQERVIDALLDWREPSTNRRAVAWALKKQDAHVLGCWGPTCGDVIFTYNPGFAWVKVKGGGSIGVAEGGANHGPQIPTAATALSSNLAMGLFRGPGIRAGSRRDPEQLGYLRMVDVVPTLCHMAGIEPPRHSQGAVARDLME